MRPMKKEAGAGKSHVFRSASPPAHAIKTATAAFAERQKLSYERWAEYRRHQNVIQESLTERLYGNQPLSPKVTASLDALRHSLGSRAPVIRDHNFPVLPIFNVRPGLNVLGPPYDFGLNVGLGSNKPAVMVDTSSGSFGVSASASSGDNTYGSAGVALFIVPSDPARTLSIRPYFQWEYTYSCESHGPPTAHAVGDVSAEVSGAAKDFPGKHMHLWSGSSDAWNDGSGDDGGVFGIPDSELVVSGQTYYIVSYVCQTSGDSHKNVFGWSASFMQLHCRVPFLVVEEF
jgi:hypothetical protein